MMKCENCGQMVTDADQNLWFAFNIQKGYEKLAFCSSKCLEEWMKNKKLWMWISLTLGVLMAAIMFKEFGAIAVVFIFAPCKIRQVKNSLKGVGEGPTGEFIWLFVVLIGSITIVYPLYKLIQELKEYGRIKSVLSKQ